jgi:hypothetical protein
MGMEMQECKVAEMLTYMLDADASNEQSLLAG